MTVFRCPYCRQTIGTEVHSHCPHCGRAMRIPERLRDPEERAQHLARIRAKRRLAEAGTEGVGSWLAERRPIVVMTLLALVVLTGGLLALRSREAFAPAAPVSSGAETAARDLRVLRIALERFRSDSKRYPTTSEGLQALVRDRNVIGWRGPYVNLIRPDPWFRPYVYRFEDGTMQLFSMGQDGLENTADDVFPAPPTPEEVAGADERWRLREHDAGE